MGVRVCVCSWGMTGDCVASGSAQATSPTIDPRAQCECRPQPQHPVGPARRASDRNRRHPALRSGAAAAGAADHRDHPLAAGRVGDITAPLVSGAPASLDVSIPCSAIATPRRRPVVWVFATNPPNGIDASRNGLFVRPPPTASSWRSATPSPRWRHGRRSRPAPARCCTSGPIRVRWARTSSVSRSYRNGSADKKPQVTGVFTDLKVPAQQGLRPVSTSTPGSSPARRH